MKPNEQAQLAELDRIAADPDSPMNDYDKAFLVFVREKFFNKAMSVGPAATFDNMVRKYLETCNA